MKVPGTPHIHFEIPFPWRRNPVWFMSRFHPRR